MGVRGNVQNIEIHPGTSKNIAQAILVRAYNEAGRCISKGACAVASVALAVKYVKINPLLML